ncbi:hypothetical protein [Frankia sp. Cas3]|uniref:hypothetical protein n=1 Tax=Frankia sp. Cas3 TaxID=3073926 RepID=UPI002AD21B9B|nr:hypothetical protein [Frankia sp. Cas3]
MDTSRYVPRIADGRLASLLAGLPAVMVTGPRAAWLRDQLGSDFRAGVVFHTGPIPFDLDDRIWALPICALWAARTG